MLSDAKSKVTERTRRTLVGKGLGGGGGGGCSPQEPGPGNSCQNDRYCKFREHKGLKGPGACQVPRRGRGWVAGRASVLPLF